MVIISDAEHGFWICQSIVELEHNYILNDYYVIEVNAQHDS